jgi:hypothetical protein
MGGVFRFTQEPSSAVDDDREKSMFRLPRAPSGISSRCLVTWGGLPKGLSVRRWVTGGEWAKGDCTHHTPVSRRHLTYGLLPPTSSIISSSQAVRMRSSPMASWPSSTITPRASLARSTTSAAPRSSSAPPSRNLSSTRPISSASSATSKDRSVDDPSHPLQRPARASFRLPFNSFNLANRRPSSVAYDSILALAEQECEAGFDTLNPAV